MAEMARVRLPALLLGVLALVLAVGVGVVKRTGDSGRIDACAVVPATALRTLGLPETGRSFEPDGGLRRATGCNFGPGEPAAYAIVFAAPTGGRDLVDSQEGAFADQDVAVEDLSGRGYEVYKTAGPRENSESVVVLRGDRYANVVLFNAPPGTLDAVVEQVAGSL